MRRKAGKSLKAQRSGKAKVGANVHLGGLGRLLTLPSDPQRVYGSQTGRSSWAAYIFCIVLWGNHVEDTNNSSGKCGVQVYSFSVLFF